MPSPLKLILHTKDGAIPFLSPHLLNTYFSPETNHLVQNHLVLGIPVKDTSITPDKNNIDVTGSYKPRCFEFQPISLHSHLRLLPGYSTLILPTFDVLDDYDQYNNARIDSTRAKKRKVEEGDTTAHSTTFHAFVGSNGKHVSLVTPHGIHGITPEQYTHVVKDSYQSDSPTAENHIVGLFDQLQGTERHKQKNNWIHRMGPWNAKIASDLLAIDSMKTRTFQDSKDITTDGDKSEDGSNMDLVPWSSNEHRLESTRFWIPIDVHLNSKEQGQYLNHLPHLHPRSFAIVGWHRINGSRIQRREILKSIVSNLNESSSPCKFAILCTEDLSQIIDAVQCGISWVGSDLPQRWAQEGKAFCLGSLVTTSAEQGEGNLPTQDGWIHVPDARFMRDREPLIQGCPCLSCKNQTHSRAYLHHLFQAHELLAQILLFGHNLHQMLLWMETLTQLDTQKQLSEFY